MKHMDEEIEKTLASLDGLRSQEVPEGFGAELRQKLRFIEKSNPWNRYFKLAIAAMILLTLGNIGVLFSLSEDPTDSQASLLELNSPTYYFETYEQD